MYFCSVSSFSLFRIYEKMNRNKRKRNNPHAYGSMLKAEK